MHESTQKALCRLVFVCLCACPTGIVMAAIVATWTPWYHDYRREAMEVILSEQFGMRIAFDAFERPAPGVMRFTGVQISEPETGAEVGRVRMISFGDLGEKRVLRLHQPELQSAQLQHAWEIVHDRFLCRPGATDQPVIVKADDLTLHSKSGGVTLRDATARIVPETKAVEATIEFIPAGRDADVKAQITVRRDRNGRLPKTHWHLYSGGVPLPCSALADYQPIMRRLGPDAEFVGALQWTLESNHWTVDLGGAEFSNVELGRIFEDLPHKLTGRASVHFDDCLIQPGEAIQVSGRLIAKNGYAGQSLLQSVQQHLGIERIRPSETEEAETSDRNVLYELMAIQFSITGPRLKLTGVCHQENGYESLEAGVILGSGGFAQVVRPSDEPLQATALAASLAPDHAVLVPLSQQTAQLHHWLMPPAKPLPEGVAPATPRISFRDASMR